MTDAQKTFSSFVHTAITKPESIEVEFVSASEKFPITK
jgi:hypothetical protein